MNIFLLYIFETRIDLETQWANVLRTTISNVWIELAMIVSKHVSGIAHSTSEPLN